MAQSIPNDPMARPAFYFGIALLGAAVFVLVSNLFSTIDKNSTKDVALDAAQSMSLASATIEENIKPIGTVKTVDKSIVLAARSGDEVYKAVCSACHATGVLDAPKFDSKEDWTPRVTQGLAGLLTQAINGKGSMPARGGNPSITDEELTNAILYMTKNAGFDLSTETNDSDSTTQDVPAPQEQAAVTTEKSEPVTTETTIPVATASTQVASIDGEKAYKSICFSCHDIGIAGAPKLGDKSVWQTRIATGIETLYQSAIQGKNVMPAKGGLMSLSDDDVKAAVDYMVKQVQ